MPVLIVGVDAGGSRTVAAAERDGRILRVEEGSGANPSAQGVEAAAGTIAATVEAACSGESAAAIVAGVAGTGDDEIRERVAAALRARFPNARVAVTHDARIALRAAIPRGDGIVLIAGTGAVAYAEIGALELLAGGYGYLLGDAGSGFAIGAAALRQEIANGRRQLLAQIYAAESPVADIAAHAPAVLRNAAAGDARAGAILDTAAAELCELVTEIMTRCGDETVLPLALSGGLLRHANALTQRLEARLQALPCVRVLRERQEPYFGALAEARRLIAA